MTSIEKTELKKKVKRYIDRADDRMLNAIYAMLQSDQQQDWWDSISKGEKEAVETGLKEMKEGKTIPHEEVMKKYSKWFLQNIRNY